MPLRSKAEQAPASTPSRPQHTRRWLLFIHQLPAGSSNLRVRTWRRLQQLGALPIKNAAYVLPDHPSAREDFEWLKTEVKASGGDASVFAANNLDAWSDDALMEEFRRAGQEAYAALAGDVEKALKRPTARLKSGTRAPSIGRRLAGFRERLAAIESVDFFGSAGRDRVTMLLTELEERTSRPAQKAAPSGPFGQTDLASYQRRLWVTRPRPGVDRMASAWLIRRFIDPHARFGFAADQRAVPGDAIPFDMFGVSFSHQGEGCTFETLCGVFGIQEPAVGRIATIVHDLDLKDGKFGPSEGGTVSTLIDGLQLAHADDEQLLAEGIALFDVLYRGFEHAGRSSGPRPVARLRKPPEPKRGAAGQRRRTR